MPRAVRLSDLFSPTELRQLTARSDAAGAWAIASTWAVIALAFAALARWPSAITFVLAVVVLGGRQLALAILMHEGSHETLFRSRFLNLVVTDWLCARIVWNDLARYRTHHGRHHAHAGTELDPDRSLVRPYPTTRAALARKLVRDVTGISGLRRIAGQVLIDVGVLEYTVAAETKRRPRGGRKLVDYAREGAKNMAGVVITNALLAGVLAATGHAWLYLAWVVAYLTTFSLFIRIRSIAEHACTEATLDPFRNTRTTRAGLLARLTVAPLHVNHHLEHHVSPAVPWHRLPEMRRLLRERGLVTEPPTYLDVLRTATVRTATVARS